MLFGSLEASPSVFATTGAKLALDRLDREGFVALASIGAGRRTEPALVRQTIGFAAVFGYQWVRDWGVAAAYVGPEGSVEVLSGAAGSGILPARLGLRLHGEVWARPSEGTLLTATLILGSARTSAWSRISWGTQLWGAYLGPEATLYGDHTGYAKWSVGLHATDFKIGRFSFRASAGYQRTTEARSGSPYVAFDVWTPW
ncbi:cellulose biosynthesis protein BcsS [Methylobacterium sp. BTF04]|nr:cellulose biosynthesis protein BcsS [Methylobacterium sp. BTF04]